MLRDIVKGGEDEVEEEVEGDYANDDEDYKDTKYMTKDLSGGLNRSQENLSQSCRRRQSQCRLLKIKLKKV